MYLGSSCFQDGRRTICGLPVFLLQSLLLFISMLQTILMTYKNKWNLDPLNIPKSLFSKVPNYIDNANVHHKITNASQFYEFYTMQKSSKRYCVFICKVQYKDIIPFI